MTTTPAPISTHIPTLISPYSPTPTATVLGDAPVSQSLHCPKWYQRLDRAQPSQRPKFSYRFPQSIPYSRFRLTSASTKSCPIWRVAPFPTSAVSVRSMPPYRPVPAFSRSLQFSASREPALHPKNYQFNDYTLLVYLIERCQRARELTDISTTPRSRRGINFKVDGHTASARINNGEISDLFDTKDLASNPTDSSKTLVAPQPRTLRKTRYGQSVVKSPNPKPIKLTF